MGSNLDVRLINDFLDICAESLCPDSMEDVESAVHELVVTRHLDRGLIHKWAMADYSTADPENGQFGLGA